MNNQRLYTIAGIGIVVILITAIGLLLWQRGYIGKGPQPPQLTYKDEPIPSSIFEEAYVVYGNRDREAVDEYVIAQTTDYYVYRDILAENDIQLDPIPANVGITNIDDELPKLEEIIEEQLVSSIDFAYIKARFRAMPTLQEAEARFGNLERVARAFAESYRQKFITENPDVEAIVEESNTDPRLELINFGEKNRIILDYQQKDELEVFPTDPNFNTFLFSQQEGQVSDVYAVQHDDGKPYAYLIVYPMRVNKSEYQNFDQLYEERKQLIQQL